MEDEESQLEQALAKTEVDVDNALRSAKAAIGSLKRVRGCVLKGNLREMRKVLESAMQAATAFAQHVTQVRDGWNFDEDTYFSGRAYVDELLATAARMGLSITEVDDRLYCYPFLVRVLPRERVVMIDKMREKSLRPSALVARLQDLQKRPLRFSPEAFLASLYKAYRILAKAQGRDARSCAPVVSLVKIHELLTLLPTCSRDYSRQEFGRDLYLLDQSGVQRTRDGASVSLHASTGTRSRQQTIRIIGRDGQEKNYYGIAFSHRKEDV